MTFNSHPYGGHMRGEGPFQRGVLKYIILQHLKEKPCHGYEIIRALEDRLHGLYVPSAGTIYPRLQMLESSGYVTSVVSEGKKVYSITDEGQSFLSENEEIGQAINDRLDAWARPENTEARRRTMREFHRISDTLRWEIRRMDTSKLERIREVLARTDQEILDILGE